MLTAHYIGGPKSGLAAHLGWWATRLLQKGPYDDCTHTEGIHQMHSDGTVTIASSSIADGGVRTKRVLLTQGNWRIVDVPGWDVQRSIDWFAAATEAGMRYDKRGALATMLPGKDDGASVFCTEAVLAPFVQAAHYFDPARGLAICLSFGRDVTDDFFAGRMAP